MNRPNHFLRKTLNLCCPSRRLDDVQGDFEELFAERVEEKGRVKANIYFLMDALSLIPLKISKRSNTMGSLFKSYIKLAIRHSWKNKWSMLINVVGLSCAIGVCIFAYTFQAYNIEFDSFYPNTEKIYRIHAMTIENNRERRNELSPLAMDNNLRNEISGITKVSSYYDRLMTIKSGADFFEDGVAVVSTDFFEMFDIPLWYGSFADLGKRPMVYLTKPSAKRYFGNEMALGKELTIYLRNNRRLDVIVGGVFEDLPLNTSFYFGVLINRDDYFNSLNIEQNDWGNQAYVGHYLEINPGQEEEVISIINSYIGRQNEAHEEFKIDHFELVPFRSSLISEDELTRSYTNDRLPISATMILGVLALLIFFVACFNLANTSMALIAKRLKEIGIRKTLGSRGKQIFIQFLFEIGMISAISFSIGMLMSNTISNGFMSLFEGESFLLKDVNLLGISLFAASFLVFTTLISGLLPALYAWKFQPVAILRKSVKLKGVSLLNKVLTVAQYSISITILVTAISFSLNSDFLDQLELGYQNEGIIHLPVTDSTHHVTIKPRIEQIPGVSISSTRHHLANYGRFSDEIMLEMDTSNYDVRYYSVGSGYLDFMNVKITSGRGFIDDSEFDRQNSILVNQEFARQYFEGEDPVNQVVKVGGISKTIVGVTTDIIFNVFKSSEVRPIIFALDRQEELPHLVVKTTHGDLQEVNEKLTSIWSANIDEPYPGQFQRDVSIGNGSSQSDSIYKVFLAMAILGGLLSVIGIFSLAKLNIARRTKEVSIRKVLGASIKELIFTINHSFTIVLSVSFVLGCVLGYFIADFVLDTIYFYRVEVSILASVASGLFVMIVSLIMITNAVLVPAKSNPVTGLRVE